jgi:hypothetical protein
MVTFPCPACAQLLEADTTYRDWTVRCPLCAAEFVPDAVARTAFDAHNRDPDADARDLAVARSRAFGPGLCLELSGWIFGFLIEVGAFIRILNALVLLNNPNLRNPNDAPERAITLGIMFAFLGLPYAVALIIGGRKLRDLQSMRWAHRLHRGGHIVCSRLCGLRLCGYPHCLWSVGTRRALQPAGAPRV